MKYRKGMPYIRRYRNGDKPFGREVIIMTRFLKRIGRLQNTFVLVMHGDNSNEYFMIDTSKIDLKKIVNYRFSNGGNFKEYQRRIRNENNLLKDRGGIHWNEDEIV